MSKNPVPTALGLLGYRDPGAGRAIPLRAVAADDCVELHDARPARPWRRPFASRRFATLDGAREFIATANSAAGYPRYLLTDPGTEGEGRVEP